jgi:ketosteroid isomerase-like protein
MTPEEVARAFVSAINNHDLEYLASLMTDDHTFEDGLGHRTIGRNAMIAAWRGYFTMVPDYWIHIDRVIGGGGSVALFGRAGGTYVAPQQALDSANRWEIVAAWLAEIRGDKLAVWQVFADNLPMRRLMSGGGA